jgi:hypothetical protein
MKTTKEKVASSKMKTTQEKIASSKMKTTQEKIASSKMKTTQEKVEVCFLTYCTLGNKKGMLELQDGD